MVEISKIDFMILQRLTGIKLNHLFLIPGLFLFFILIPISIYPQSTTDCPRVKNNRADKIYDKGIRAYRQRNYSEALRQLNLVVDIEPEYVDANYVLGLIYIKDSRMNLKAAKENFLRVVEICPDYDVYAYYHLARIYYGAEDYENAEKNIELFLEDVDRIKTDSDYEDAFRILEFSRFYSKILKNPVPFNPQPVPGVSTEFDEYLPIISPDNEMALFTRKLKLSPRKNDLVPQTKFVEKFMFSKREDGEFGRGDAMPFPFNLNDNEGGATVTIDNKMLFYTLCKFSKSNKYYNCDICFSEFRNGKWGEIKNISKKVNRDDTWESQPSITSDGNILYFVSDRDGGFGGYDLYCTCKDSTGKWETPKNMGSQINTAGNEKSPFIHTDSHTLYFSSDGHLGLGGYDIFFTKLNEDGSWSEPKNIGYPINSFDDDLGFFVSTNGQRGYYASNKFEGFGGWDLYSFDLYEDARPEEVLFVKGKVVEEEMDDSTGFKNTRVELKNVETKQVTQVAVDSATGEYVTALLFQDDYIMTVKKKGFVQESKYISRIDQRFLVPAILDMNLEPIQVGKSYRLNDIYFEFNSYDLKKESEIVIEEFYDFLMENIDLNISIQGHTDNVGSKQDNLLLSENRAEAVYSYLLKLGIDNNRVDYRGHGESRPMASNETEKGRALNRRTEFVIVE